jgi:hypothetical protein
VWPTEANPDDCDVQLLGGPVEGLSKLTLDELREAAAGMLGAAGDLISNPDYHGESEDER